MNGNVLAGNAGNRRAANRCVSTHDATFAMATLILTSVQINMCAEQLPESELSGTCYIKVALNPVTPEAPPTTTVCAY